MPRSNLGYAVALVLAGLLLAPAPAQAVEPPKIDRLTGRVLHTASGDTITVPVAKRLQNSLELLGKVRAGWLVAHHWRDDMLVVSPAGRIVRTIPYSRFEDYPGSADLVLSPRGERVLILSGDRGEETDAIMLDLRGRVLARHHLRGIAFPLTTRDRTFYITLPHQFLAWRTGARPVRVPIAGVSALDVRHQLLVREMNGEEGVATRKHPDRLRWTFPRATRYETKTFAPDARHIATTSGTRSLAVFATHDGSTTTAVRFHHQVWTPPIWEDRSHVLVELTRDDLHMLVRCNLGGDCERTVRWQAHPLLYWDYTKTR